MSITKLPSTDFNFSINVTFYDYDYKIRYTTFVEDYTTTRTISYTSEAPTTTYKTYRISYESSDSDDYLNYKIRYSAFEEVEEVFQTYAIRYESDALVFNGTIYKVRYESEGIETTSFKRIYRIYYESDGVLAKNLNYKIRYNSDRVEQVFVDYTVRYTSDGLSPYILSTALLRTLDNKYDAIFGIYSLSEEIPELALINNIPRTLMLDFDFQNSNKVQHIYSIDLLDIDSEFISQHPLYTNKGFIRIKDIDIRTPISVDLYETKDAKKLLNEASSYFYDVYGGIWNNTNFTIESTNYTGYTKSQNLTVPPNTIEIEEVFLARTQDKSCCYGQEITLKNSKGVCTP